jgi:hypothetical protein
VKHAVTNTARCRPLAASIMRVAQLGSGPAMGLGAIEEPILLGLVEGCDRLMVVKGQTVNAH